LLFDVNRYRLLHIFGAARLPSPPGDPRSGRAGSTVFLNGCRWFFAC
ncbi:unnamed protein product, partial [Musa acuminata subsp. burmannicoides]